MQILSSGFSGSLSISYKCFLNLLSSSYFFWCKPIPKLKLFPKYLKLSPFFTIGIFWSLIIKCGSSWTAAVDDFLTPNVTHLLIFTIKSSQLHHFVNRFHKYWWSDPRAVMTNTCGQYFVKLRVFDVYPRHLTLSWFTVSINVLKHKLNKSVDKQ